jgi:propanol-preferring alcohol dehydrogenase
MAAPISIPPYYRGAVYDKLGEISTKILEMKVPKPGVGEVLVNL